jgi:hypothetical protein
MLVRLESDVEKKVCKHADELGIMHIKINIRGRRGWPDREFLIPGGKPLFIEFKRPGEKVEPIQEFIHGQLRDAGYNVLVVDNATCGIAALESTRVSAESSKASAGTRWSRFVPGSRSGED